MADMGIVVCSILTRKFTEEFLNLCTDVGKYYWLNKLIEGSSNFVIAVNERQQAL